MYKRMHKNKETWGRADTNPQQFENPQNLSPFLFLQSTAFANSFVSKNLWCSFLFLSNPPIHTASNNKLL